VMHTVTVGSKGQIVIPADVRRELGIEPGQRIEVSQKDGHVVLRPLPKDLLASLRGRFKGGPSMLADLIAEHAEEVRRDAEGHLRRVRADSLPGR
jgi:AbrB family looped-hinge helix DNA binding protein